MAWLQREDLSDGRFGCGPRASLSGRKSVGLSQPPGSALAPLAMTKSLVGYRFARASHVPSNEIITVCRCVEFRLNDCGATTPSTPIDCTLVTEVTIASVGMMNQCQRALHSSE